VTAVKSDVKHGDTVYMDNAATTRVSEGAIVAMMAMMRDEYFNPSALYRGAVAVERHLVECRSALAGRQNAERIVYTSGGTEADNLALLGLRLRKPGVVLVSAAEHSAILKLRGALEESGHSVRTIPLTPDGVVDLDTMRGLLAGGVSLISVTEVCNVTGAAQPLADVVLLRDELCPDALIHSDGVQGFMRMGLSPMKNGVDLYSISAHKIHGPKGVGALALSKRASLKLSPRSFGGSQESGLRAGTENAPGIVGLDAAWRELDADPALIGAMRTLKVRLFRTIAAAIPDIQVNGPDPESTASAPHILNISPPGIGGEPFVHALEAEGVYAGTGSACSSKSKEMNEGFKSMGLARERAERAVRLSLSPHTTVADVDRTADAFIRCHMVLFPYSKRI